MTKWLAVAGAICLMALGASGCDRLSPKPKDEAAGPRSMPDFGGVETVEVETEGVGPTRNAAILDALNLAVRKTNGTPIVGLTVSSNGHSAIGDFNVTLDNVVTVTQGAVTRFDILSEKGGGKTWRVKVKAGVAKVKGSAAASMPKVVIAPARARTGVFTVGDEALSAQDAGAGVHAAIADSLGRSNRFFVIDRAFDDALDAEAANITAGNANPAELAKLGQRLTADILIQPDIRRLEYRKSSRTLHYSGRELRSYAGGADIAFNVVNVATGQLILSKTYTVTFPATPPTVRGQQAIGGSAVSGLLATLAEQFTREFVQKNFPVSIVKMDGATVTLSQGDPAVTVGTVYDVISLGEELKDPQTGQSLGRLESPVGMVTVTKATDRIAFGTFQGSFNPAAFKPGVLELRSRMSDAVVASKTPYPSGVPAAAGPARPAAVAATRPRPARKAKDDFNSDYNF